LDVMESAIMLVRSSVPLKCFALWTLEHFIHTLAYVDQANRTVSEATNPRSLQRRTAMLNQWPSTPLNWTLEQSI